MWDTKQMGDYLFKLAGTDVYNEKIKPDMKKIVKYSLQAAQDILEGRKNSHEFFGYDFMVDD